MKIKSLTIFFVLLFCFGMVGYSQAYPDDEGSHDDVGCHGSETPNEPIVKDRGFDLLIFTTLVIMIDSILFVVILYGGKLLR